MSDIIRLLPDSVANQIAAGEVIQRPSSVVKELVENAIDAHADHIQINIKDAGRTLIQVIDNGKGMSETDARMAFERHATSKISKAEDLFALATMGFRGEALASIAAIAHVELKTKTKEQETGTLISISASRLEKQEEIATNTGSTFSIKNLFFNVPARRKFLKSNETEFRNILSEFERIVLVNPEISFSLFHNDAEVFNLPASVTRQRIVNTFGKSLNQTLLPLHIETSLIKISGFIGTPDSAKKRGALQFFFVNGRFMKHAYFHKAVMQAFEPFIPIGEMPNYFIYFNADPSNIDVNIHPTKTEIKFEHEQSIWPIIMAAVKETIGKTNAAPTIDFNQKGAIDIPVYNQAGTSSITTPKINYNSNYNPFKQKTSGYQRPNLDWEELFEKKEKNDDIIPEIKPESSNEKADSLFESEQNHIHYLYKGKYIITALKSGLVLIDQRRAHIRILYDQYINQISQQKGVSQGLLFPEIITFTPQEAAILPVLLEELSYIGFDLSDFGNNSYAIHGIPSGLENINAAETLKDMVNKAMETGCEIKEEICEALALSLAKKAAIPYGKTLSSEEADHLISNLFYSKSANYTPDGKLIISIINNEELDKRFK